MKNTLKAARTAARMSQTDLAARMHCDRSMISRMENGEREASVRLWKAAGRALKIDWRELVG